ncbi:MAG: Tex family protein [Chthoniobacteraceae bacterium]|nr:Tex family protein [Chthoniobacteraceae bacterium]
MESTSSSVAAAASLAPLSPKHLETITRELTLQPRQVMATALLLKEGATVPFIARYRKEVTGTLDEVAIAAIRDRMESLATLDARRDAILKSLDERKLLTADLRKAVDTAETLTALEDIYLPYRPKKRTRATIAKEQGLEPLADLLFTQAAEVDPRAAAEPFLEKAKTAEPPLATVEAALAGARDILAERFADDKDARAKLRAVYQSESTLTSKVFPGKETEGAKFKDYFDWTEPAAKSPSHRVLAIRRGEKEGFLMMRVHPTETSALGTLEPMFVKAKNPAADQVRQAVQESYKRLLGPAMETEIRLELKRRADEEAIRVFADNLRELLLASPLGQKSVLAIDPGFRTGCKVVVLDAQGKLLHHDVVFPEQGARSATEAAEKVLAFVKHFKIESVAIGNGTAGRETETFVRKLGLPASIPIVMVNESGASIYSASEAAREEFPDQDITVRGAVSIGRRLMDPLAELVKIDPKSIGVGQYQHDVDQSALKKSLDDVVISSVNRVGVELNTASKQLLAYVSGIGPSIADAIVAYRNEHGAFPSRKELLKVPRLGPKAFEQAAGFLRVRNAENPLDESAVHPESYGIVDAMARDLGCSVRDLIKNEVLRKKIVFKNYVTEKVGLPTLNDILTELAKPGRDPRQKFEAFSFTEGVAKITDLQPGMKLPGIVTNVAAFGAFVDIGVHQDGLVHISQLSDNFVKDPADVVKVQQRVMVTVMEVDLERKRIALSLKSKPDLTPRSSGGGSGPRSGGNGPRSFGGSPRPGQSRNSGGNGGGGMDWFTAAMNKGKK